MSDKPQTKAELETWLYRWESLAEREQVYNGNKAVADLAAQVRSYLAAQPTGATQPTVEQVADVFAIHRWKSMGVASVSCECGEILYGDKSLTQFPADEAFREHLARAVMALYAGSPTVEQVKAEALREAAQSMRRAKDPGHWNLRDPGDPEASYSPDVWLEKLAHRGKGE